MKKKYPEIKIISNSKQILELGSSPGGWSQVIININNKVLKTLYPKLKDHPDKRRASKILGKYSSGQRLIPGIFEPSVG